MIFTLVSGAQDKLAEVLDAFREEKERRIKEKEEELKRIEEVCLINVATANVIVIIML